jgi:hypothetical protein
MVTYNKKERTLSITIDAIDMEQIPELQKAIIDLMAHYNYDQFGHMCHDTIYYSTMLLEGTFTNTEQLQKCFSEK